MPKVNHKLVIFSRLKLCPLLRLQLMQNIDFAKYLLKLNPEADAARLALYHYFKNHLPSQMPLTAESLNRFYSRALSFSYWQENRAALETEVRMCVESFLENEPVE